MHSLQGLWRARERNGLGSLLVLGIRWDTARQGHRQINESLPHEETPLATLAMTSWVLETRYLYGANFSECFSMSSSEIYFHLPPLLFSFLTSFPLNAAIPRLPWVSRHLAGLHLLRTHCTPKSPVENTSILFNAKHANISTLHLPSPRTAVSFSSTSS